MLEYGAEGSHLLYQEAVKVMCPRVHDRDATLHPGPAEPPPTGTPEQARMTLRAQAVTATTVAGTYRYKTYRPGKEGYDNTLEIEDKGDGKLHISLYGAYKYRREWRWHKWQWPNPRRCRVVCFREVQRLTPPAHRRPEPAAILL